MDLNMNYNCHIRVLNLNLTRLQWWEGSLTLPSTKAKGTN
jgi:hypothetical protein